MKKTAIILIILQTMAYTSAFARQSFTWTRSIPAFLGFNILAIIAIILLTSNIIVHISILSTKKALLCKQGFRF